MLKEHKQNTNMVVKTSNTNKPIQSDKYFFFNKIVSLVIFFLIINIILTNFGPTPMFFTKTIVVILVLILGALQCFYLKDFMKNYEFGITNNLLFIGGFFLIFFGFILMIVTLLTTMLLGAFLLLMSGLYIINYSTNNSRFLSDLWLTSFFVFIFYILAYYISFLWSWLQIFSQFFGLVLSGEIVDLGVSFVGFWICFPILIWSFIVNVSMGKSWIRKGIRFFLFLFVFVVVWKLYVLIFINYDLLNFDLLFLYFIGLFIVGMLVVFVVFYRYLVGDSGIGDQDFRRLFRKNKVFVLGVFLVLVVVSLGLIVPFGSDRVEQVSVAFYGEDMLGSWDHPEYGRYGREASGMYGLLPLYLNSWGYGSSIIVDNRSDFLNRTYVGDVNTTRFVNLSDEVVLVKASSLCEVDFSVVDVLVVVGHNRSLTVDEYACIWEFVLSGGGLLVLGDHTDVGGMRDPLNAVLDPVDIGFRFDSALPLDDRWKWETCAMFLGDELSFSVGDARDFQISVGASLDVGGGAFPLIVGRYGFSDVGDVENADFAFLGNYVYDVGEQLGDVVLAAGSYYGDGRVVVFGDTSSFQNSAIPRSYELVDAVFQWLGDDDGLGDDFWLDVGALLLFCVFVVLLIVLKGRDLVVFVGVGVVLMVVLAVVSAGSCFVSEVSFRDDHVVIDVGLGEQVAIDPFHEDSLSGLVLNFHRNGLLPLYVGDGFDVASCDAGFIVFNAPTCVLSDSLVLDLVAYMNGGGVVVVASGFLDKEAVVPLLERFGLDVDNVPLGPVPYVEGDPASFEFEPRFVNSWPIRFESSSVRSFYNFSWNDVVYHLMVFQPVGDGGLLLVSDGEFLLDDNIESIYDYWPGNIIFLKHIIDEVYEGSGVR